MTEENNDGRLSFDAAVAFVRQHPDRAAFAAIPVLGDDGQAAEGARVFIVATDGAGGYQVRFVAGPFFANVFAANETMAPDDVPERVRELRFLPTRLEEEWLTGQVQILIQKLAQASGQAAPQMPDYASAPVVGAGAEEVFPISFVGSRDAS
jgi:hypothetical protein